MKNLSWVNYAWSISFSNLHRVKTKGCPYKTGAEKAHAHEKSQSRPTPHIWPGTDSKCPKHTCPGQVWHTPMNLRGVGEKGKEEIWVRLSIYIKSGSGARLWST